MLKPQFKRNLIFYIMNQNLSNIFEVVVHNY